MVPYIFSCSRATAEVTDALGWQSVQVAEDNLIDLPELAFKGKKWQDIRTALNKAPKEGVTFRMVTLADESWAMVRQVEHLSQEWLGDKELPEMGFTLGGVTEALDREVKVGLAVGADGTLHGVTSWMPVYGGDGEIVGWTLDLMRRADGGFRATMEFLIASSCLYFKEQGALYVSLSGAPLARSDADPSGETADREVPGHPRRHLGAGLRIPVAARLQEQVPAAALADVHGVPGRGRPAADRHRDHPRLPADRRGPRHDLGGEALNSWRRDGSRRCSACRGYGDIAGCGCANRLGEQASAQASSFSRMSGGVPPAGSAAVIDGGHLGRGQGTMSAIQSAPGATAA